MKFVFADTHYWIALTNARDQAHTKALGVSKSLGRAQIITTDEVLTEFLAYCASDPQLRVEAAATVENLLRASRVQVIPQSRDTFLAGLDLYRSRPDKGFSLTDCISMGTMRRMGISEVLTNDRHFQQEGFTPLFRD